MATTPASEQIVTIPANESYTPPVDISGGPSLEEQAAEMDKGSEEEAPAPKTYTQEEVDALLAKGKEPAEEEPKPETTEETPEAKVEREALEAKQAPYTEEFATSGTLSDESIAKAAKEFGVSEDMVRTYVEGLKGSQEAAMAPFIETVGGDWSAFDAWAADNIPEADRVTLNAALEKDPKTALLALKPFADKFKSDGGANPPSTLTRSGSGGPQGSDVFGSMEEQRQAQNDPRYKADDAFRASVDAKIGRSNSY